MHKCIHISSNSMHMSDSLLDCVPGELSYVLFVADKEFLGIHVCKPECKIVQI